ncbi:MAG: peptidylprolyl isomerase [Acidimicrobiia bacterium]|jgi:cyclophilin family peptidyl-prolyl cis-trans isomerase
MPTEKRQRQDEGRLARLEAERQAQRRAQRARNLRNLLLLLGALVLVALAISLLSGDDGEEVSTEGTTTTEGEATDDTSEDPGEPVEVVLPGAGASITGETPCPPADGSAERTTSFEQAPPMCIDPAKTYTATLQTTEGDIVVELDAEAAPETVNNFVVLARYDFYDNVPFHRIIPGFMIQAGDPVGPTPGTGGPGYTIADELPTGEDPYPTGTLAMANTGQPDSGGSQWFITVEGGGAQLTPTYTAFGRVVEGQDVVDAINQHGDAATNGTPTKIVAITDVIIDEA